MRISEKEINKMYKKVNLEREKLHDALITMGRKYIKGKKLKDNWSEDNPTKNYCYVVSEFVYYYLSPRGSKPYKLNNIPNDDGIHRFIKYPCGTIIDLTVEQFPNYEDVDYSKSKICYFMVSKWNKGPCYRTRKLAEVMGYELPKWREDLCNTKDW